MRVRRVRPDSEALTATFSASKRSRALPQCEHHLAALIDSSTKAVTSSLAKDPQLKKIDVRTDAGVVVLSGEVQTMAQSAKASDLAHRIDGVKSVKNELRVSAAKAS